MPERLEPVFDAQGRRLCVKCLERPAEPGHVKRRVYRCQPCYNISNRAASQRYRDSDRNRAAQFRYRHSDKGRSWDQQYQARKVVVSGRHYLTAETPEQARIIRDHIRRRLHEFVEGLSARAETKGI